MAKETFNGCSYSNIWVHPHNWKNLTSKKSLDLNWYVECKFYDPRYKEKYPKGFPYRKKLNKFKTLEKRKAAIELYLKEIPILFEVKGYNPIPTEKNFMVKQIKVEETTLHPDLNYIDAFRRALLKVNGEKKHLDQIRFAINRLEKGARQLGLIDIKIKDFKRSQLKQILEQLDLPPNYYNKFKSYLSSLFIELVDYECCETNITRDIRKKTVIKRQREVLTAEQFKEVITFLHSNCYTFYRYAMIFMYSGSRTEELMRLQKKDVDLEKREFKVLIKKGKLYEEEIKVMLDGSEHLWQEVLNECENDDDFLFSLKLKPGPKKNSASQITKRWNRHAKKKLLITADFYALKHYFLDEFDVVTAMNIASHRNERTTKIYQVLKKKKKREELKKLKIGELKKVV